MLICHFASLQVRRFVNLHPCWVSSPLPSKISWSFQVCPAVFHHFPVGIEIILLFAILSQSRTGKYSLGSVYGSFKPEEIWVYNSCLPKISLLETKGVNGLDLKNVKRNDNR